MRLRDRLYRMLTGTTGGGDPLPSRHARREAARRRHRVYDEPLWPAEDRHENPDEGREVSDIAPGLPGAGVSHRFLGRRRR